MSDTTTNDAPDLLYGVPAIADYLGLKRDAVYHLIHTKRLPAFKVGKTVCARRSKLMAFDALEEQHAQADVA